MRLSLNLDKPLTIQDLYDKVAIYLGKDEKSARYDCTKIRVSENIYNMVEQIYGVCIFSFAMDWLNYGPKVDESLKDYEVDIEDGFFIDGEE